MAGTRLHLGRRMAFRSAVAGAGAIAGAAVALASLTPDDEAPPPPAPVPAPALAGPTGVAAAHCRHVAAPGGRDSWPGTRRRPYRTVTRLVRSLRPGATGCLRGGTYAVDELTLRTDGIRLTGYRGERARLRGRIRVTGDDVLVDHLTLDGRNARRLPSPTINGDGVVFERDDVSDAGRTGCFLLGSTRAIRGTVLRANRIHHCGNPATLYGHGIYMQDVDGARIVGNWIHDNADRGIKVGPDAQGSLIRGNVITGNAIGLNFSGVEDMASSHNVVERNVIAEARRWYNVQSYWPGSRVGEGNVVRANCVHSVSPDPDLRENGGISAGAGFTAYGNLVADPRFVDRAAGDLRLGPRSPCRRVVGEVLPARVP